ESALADYTEACRLDPENAQAHQFAGVAYAKVGKVPQALASLTEGLRLAPSNARLRAHRAVVYQTAGEPDRALDDFAGAVRLEPRYAAAYAYQRGLHQASRGDHLLAVADYTVALQLDPSNPAVEEAREQALRAYQVRPRPA